MDQNRRAQRPKCLRSRRRELESFPRRGCPPVNSGPLLRKQGTVRTGACARGASGPAFARTRKASGLTSNPHRRFLKFSWGTFPRPWCSPSRPRVAEKWLSKYRAARPLPRLSKACFEQVAVSRLFSPQVNHLPQRSSRRLNFESKSRSPYPSSIDAKRVLGGINFFLCARPVTRIQSEGAPKSRNR